MDNRQDAGGVEGPAGEIRTSSGDFTKQARDLAGDAAAAIKSQADNLTDTAKGFVSDAGEKLRDGVNDQKALGADYVQGVAGMIRRSASEFDNDLPQASHYIRKAASQLEGVSDAMRNHDMSEIVGSVQDFARKQPTAFFSAAVLVGFAAVRFVKSGSDKSAQSPSSTVGGAND